MRAFALAVAALALSACGSENSSNQTEASACAAQATHNVTWSETERQDAIVARAEGPSCTQAVVVWTMRNADGDALWVFASTYYDMTAGGNPPDDAPATEASAVQEFLTSWVNVTEMRSGQLPEWRADQSRPGEGVEPFGYETPFDREVYDMMRQRNLPTICYAAAVAAVQCLVMDPASHAPTMIVAYGS